MHKIFTKTVFIGKKVIFLPTCHSTNDYAAQLIEQKDVTNGQLIVTDYQHTGRGHRGNIWHSETGKNLLFSIVLDVSFLDVSESFALTIVTSLAVTDAINDYISYGIKVKWPNDIYFFNEKICGILIENIIKGGEIDKSIIGIGLNINQTDFTFGNATSLRNICNQKIDRFDFLELLLQYVEKRYYQLEKKGLDYLLQYYKRLLYWRNEIHVFRSNGELFNGKILGVQRNGKLHVEIEDGERFFGFKEVEYIK